MGKDSKCGAFKERAKHRVDDLHGMFSDMLCARKDSRSSDAAVLEEQVHQMLREWKAELNEPSPASSLQAGSLGTFSSDIARLLQLCEEQDDATSALAAPKSEPGAPGVDNSADLQEGFIATQLPQEQQNFQLLDHQKNFHVVASNMQTHNFGDGTQLDYEQLEFHQNFDQQYFLPAFDVSGLCEEEALQHNPDFTQNLYPPPAAAFLGPKCALWDCARLAKWSEWQDYCSYDHARLALEEGCLGSAPILRPGICLKDSILFAALSAKAQGKQVGVPECEGAATARSPWNAPELFNLATPEGETITIREWLFFDKPRRAFESGNRKQRALPDYTGRGWHESRKQEFPECKGLKRSYYMDPQPLKTYEWHLFEHEIEKFDSCALYRLEYKLADGKKNARGKAAVDDLQKQMKNLNAESPTSNGKSGGRKSNSKDPMGRNICPTSAERLQPPRDMFEYGPSASCEYLGDNGNVNGNGYYYP